MKNKFEELYEQAILESSLSRIRDKIMNYSCGAISAFRGNKTYSENMENHKKLQAYLQSKNYSITLVQGTYVENYYSKVQGQIDLVKRAAGQAVELPKNERHVSEKSFFVCNQNIKGDDGGKLKNDLIKLGKHFDQDSVLIVPVGGEHAYLYGTSDRNEAYPGMDIEKDVGKGRFGKTATEFLSKIGGRPFSFEGKEEDLYDPEGEFKVYEDVLQPDTINGKWAQSVLLKEIKNALGEN